MALRRLKKPFMVDFVVLSCAPRHFSVIFGTMPISLGIPTEKGLSCARAKNYLITSKHYGTPSSQKSIFCRFCRVIVRAAGFLRHFWHKTHFPWHSDRRGSTTGEHGGILSHVVTQWHYVVSKSIFGRFFWLIVRREGCLRHLWLNTHFPWHSDGWGSTLGERGGILSYFVTQWHAVVSKIHLLSILSGYRARRGISPPFMSQHPFPLAFRQRRVSAMRARKTIPLCRSSMARRRLKNPSFVDFVVLSCAPRDFSAIFGTIPIFLGNRTEEALGWTTEMKRISIIVSWSCGDVVSRKKLKKVWKLGLWLILNTSQVFQFVILYSFL